MQNKDEAQYAIQGSSYIKICSRQIRVELAKCQRKIQIILNDASLNVEEVKKVYYASLNPYPVLYCNALCRKLFIFFRITLFLQVHMYLERLPLQTCLLSSFTTLKIRSAHIM